MTDPEHLPPPPGKSHWEWRLSAARLIAARLDPARLGVVACYLIGSTKNAVAGPCSDIDLVIHVRGDESQRDALLAELRRWNPVLDQWNFERTGQRCGELLDIHLVTDDDIARRSSFAVRISAVSDRAWLLPIGTESGTSEQ
ncbi:MAG TPA: hypothetical protein PLN26_14505 [Acidobacteriota bacterium]|nr:hypothetical protein [Acidobacteriota bacterium]HQF88433.1 hypothetical protein [Acidobacteriota bacterium]HQG92844.1 hypothetical protein [Acidobacteriota bacterium]HQK86787.1 hypothetical protein [Acidobacteriota bacterium]